jgi:hypothetical protein
MSIWDDPELHVSDDYVKFETPGDTITGTITALRIHRFDDKPVPQIVIRTPEGHERTVTGGQARLKALLTEKRPDVGDTITITMTNVEKRAGGKTLKHFEVVVSNGAAPATTPTATTTATAPALDPAVAAAMSNLTPEQIEAAKQLLA